MYTSLCYDLNQKVFVGTWQYVHYHTDILSLFVRKMLRWDMNATLYRLQTERIKGYPTFSSQNLIQSTKMPLATCKIGPEGYETFLFYL
jgi:hypothetical protein